MFLFPAGGDSEKVLQTVRGIVERHGGNVLVLKKWDERKLAYEIGRHKRGLYIICYFDAPTNAVGPIERDVNLSEEVLRVMVTSADHLTQTEMAAVEPQPIQPREERNTWDRPDRGGDRGGDRGHRRDRDDRGPREGGGREGGGRERGGHGHEGRAHHEGGTSGGQGGGQSGGAAPAPRKGHDQPSA
jgi:small subunit ribosomal protein S6